MHLSRRRHEFVTTVSTCLSRILARGQAEGVFNNRHDTSGILLMTNIITNGAVATGPTLIAMMAPEMPSCPKHKASEALCAEFILASLTRQQLAAAPGSARSRILPVKWLAQIRFFLIG